MFVADDVLLTYVFGWLLSKVRRAGKRADEHVDAAVDASVDRLGRLVAAKLGRDSAFERLESEAGKGLDRPSELTARRLKDALTQAAEDDPQFAVEVENALREAVKNNVVVRVDGSEVVKIKDSGIISGDADASSSVVVAVDKSKNVVIEGSGQIKSTPGG